MEDKLEKLHWIRIFTPHHIPRKYVEQLKDVNFTPDDFYKYQEKVCVISPSMQINPLNHLYVLADEENLVKGFIWVVVDQLGQDLVIQSLSIDPNYWMKGKVIQKVTELLEPLRVKAQLNKVVWLTRAPRYAEKYGFKRSREVLMEYDPNQSLYDPNSSEEIKPNTSKESKSKKAVTKNKSCE